MSQNMPRFLTTVDGRPGRFAIHHPVLIRLSASPNGGVANLSHVAPSPYGIPFADEAARANYPKIAGAPGWEDPPVAVHRMSLDLDSQTKLQAALGAADLLCCLWAAGLQPTTENVREFNRRVLEALPCAGLARGW